jgi:sugar lactone lactonase YvrE
MLSSAIAIAALSILVLCEGNESSAIPPSRDNRRFPMIMAAAIDPDAKYFILGEWRDWQNPRGLLRCFELSSGKELKSLPESVGFPSSISISTDGRYLASTAFSPDGCRIWDMTTRTKTARIFEASEAVDFSPDGKQIVLGSPNSRIFAYSVPEWKKLDEFERTFTRTSNADFSNVKSIDVAPNGKLVAGAHNGVRIWDMATRKEVQVPYGPVHQWFRAVAFSPDSELLACMNADGLRCWNVEKKEEAWRWRGMYQMGLAWKPDGTALVASSRNEGVHLLDPESGRTIEVLHKPPFWATALAFSPDGQWLVAGGQMEIRVHNLKTGKDTIIKQEPFIEK